MKVALCGNNYPPEFRGGTERVMQALAHALRGEGVKVLVICGSELPHAGEDITQEQDEGISVFRLPLQAGEGYGLNVPRPRIQELVQQILQKEKAQLLHAHHWSHLSDGLLRMAREMDLSTVATLHDMWTHCPRFFRAPPAGSGIVCPEAMQRDACISCANLELGEAEELVSAELRQRDANLRAELTAAQALTAPSQACADAALQHLKLPDDLLDRGLEVIPHGLLEPVPAKPQDSTGQPAVFRIGSFGNLDESKGLSDLLAATAGIPNVSLHLAGGFPKQEFQVQLQAKARALGVELQCTGAYQPNQPHPVQSMDLAVFPSLCQETYGLVVEEALAHGVPVIVSDRGALPERVARGGGLVVPAGEVDKLHQAMASLRNDGDAYQQCRNSIPQSFPSIEDAARLYRNLYRKVLHS